MSVKKMQALGSSLENDDGAMRSGSEKEYDPMGGEMEILDTPVDVQDTYISQAACMNAVIQVDSFVLTLYCLRNS